MDRKDQDRPAGETKTVTYGTDKCGIASSPTVTASHRAPVSPADRFGQRTIQKSDHGTCECGAVSSADECSYECTAKPDVPLTLLQDLAGWAEAIERRDAAIRTLRDVHGLSYRAIGQQAGLSHTQVANICREP